MTCPFAHHVLKKQKVTSREQSITFLYHLLPTSDLCKRLVSKAGNARNDRKKALPPVHFESPISLNLNRYLLIAETFRGWVCSIGEE